MPEIEPHPRTRCHCGAAQPPLGTGDCERLQDGCVAQPVNTATSLAYVVTAAALLARLGRSGVSERGGAGAFAGTCALVGVGSVAFHGPQPRGAGLMHDLPIAAMLGLLAGTPALRSRQGRDPLPGWSKRRGVAMAGLGAAAGIAYVAGRTGARTCDPDSAWQWHGVWHVLSAAAFGVAGEVLHGSAPGRS